MDEQITNAEVTTAADIGAASGENTGSLSGEELFEKYESGASIEELNEMLANSEPEESEEESGEEENTPQDGAEETPEAGEEAHDGAEETQETDVYKRQSLSSAFATGIFLSLYSKSLVVSISALKDCSISGVMSNLYSNLPFTARCCFTSVVIIA